MKRILLLVVYNLVFVVIGLLVLEFAVRIFKPEINSQGTDKVLIKDSVYFSSQGLNPNASGISNGVILSVDQYGFRKNTAPVDTSKKSILLIGDSVTMGLGVDSSDTFANLLQKRMMTKNILNPSMFGYDVQDYKNVFRHFTEKNRLKIDEVVVCWCLNDIYNDNIKDTEVPGGGIRYFFNDFLSYLRRNSRFYTYLKTMVSDRSESYYLFDSQLYNDKNMLKEAADILTSINNECKRAGIVFGIVLLPYEYQIRTKSRYPQSELKEKFERFGIPTINVFDVFQSAQPKDYFLYGDGIHFSPEGHKVIADFLYNGTPLFKTNL